MVEQLSILVTDRLIDAETLVAYLPDERRIETALAPRGDIGGTESLNEREMLYKFLFDIKQDVSELKTLMYSILSARNPQTPQITDYRRMLAAGNTGADSGTDFVLHEENIREEIGEEDETLSLQEKEKQLIKKALGKHHGKRKPAAKELGISERTLYRKIKEFGLDDV